MRHQRWTSEPCTAKSIFIKNGKCRSGDCAWKAAGITPGGLLLRRDNATEGAERRPDRTAEVSRGLTRERREKPTLSKDKAGHAAAPVVSSPGDGTKARTIGVVHRARVS